MKGNVEEHRREGWADSLNEKYRHFGGDFIDYGPKSIS
jgi:hypothetical protein